MAGKVFFSVTMSLDGFMAPEAVSVEYVFSPEGHFVNDRIDSALAQAREAAGDRDVRIAGGAETIQEYLDSGLIDEFSITLAPVLSGTGIRLFDRVNPDRLGLDQARANASSRVTHLTYTAAKR